MILGAHRQRDRSPIAGYRRNKPTKTLEFKCDLSSPCAIIKTVVAALNDEERLANLIAERIAPTVRSGIEVVALTSELLPSRSEMYETYGLAT